MTFVASIKGVNFSNYNNDYDHINEPGRTLLPPPSERVVDPDKVQKRLATSKKIRFLFCLKMKNGGDLAGIERIE